MTYEARWYLCEISDSSEIIEPDWSRIPEAKRELVRARFMASAPLIVDAVLLWGPQIPFFASRPYYTVKVLDV